MNSTTQESFTVLVVDDEPMIRFLILEFFIRTNIRVLEASNGQEALQKIDRENRYPDIIVTDLRMPGMDGLELLHQLRQKAPLVKVLIISGFYEDTLALSRVLDEKTRFLQKPFSLEMLEQCLQSLHPSLPFEWKTKVVAAPAAGRRSFRRNPVPRTRHSS